MLLGQSDVEQKLRWWKLHWRWVSSACEFAMHIEKRRPSEKMYCSHSLYGHTDGPNPAPVGIGMVETMWNNTIEV